MAEDDTNAQDMTEAEDEDAVGQRIIQEHRENQRRRKCPTRLEELATPNRRLILAVYREHAHHFEKERVEALKRRLQELYAMTPEETEQYFAKLREEAGKLAWRRRVKEKLRRLVAKKNRIADQKRAYKLLKKLLKWAMNYAYVNELPMVVSARLRLLADIILEQLCELRGIEVPDRDTSDKMGRFFIAVADWFAIAVENLYYVVQVKKNEEQKEIEASQIQDDQLKGDFAKGNPPATSTPRNSFSFDEKPLASSTPRGSTS